VLQLENCLQTGLRDQERVRQCQCPYLVLVLENLQIHRLYQTQTASLAFEDRDTS
jgi:hypothetical protein